MTDTEPTTDHAEPVLTAAQNIIDNLRTPGVSDRVDALRVALQDLLARDPVAAVVVTAALWVDRYGSAGAPLRLTDLQDAVDGLARHERGLERLFSAVERPFDGPVD